MPIPVHIESLEQQGYPDLGHLAYADYLRWTELSCAEMIMGIPDTLDEAEAVGARNRVARQAIDCLDRLLAGRVEIGGFGGTHGCLGTGAARQNRRHGDQG